MEVWWCSRGLLCRLPRAFSHVPRVHHHHEPSRRILASRLFQPVNLEERELGKEGQQSDLSCRSQRLMLQAGLIFPSSPGCYHYLPSTVRAMEKLVRLIDEEMHLIGGQKLNMPSLSAADLWKRSERWMSMGRELFRLKDRHDADYCLGPTHEEMVTELIASQGSLSYKQLPLLLYQITRKFRDEPKPRFGLLRGREFYMKDMYTFDVSEEAAQQTYQTVCQAYSRLFSRLGLGVVKVQADTGSIGGTQSHEFQLPADVGEDTLLTCLDCGFAANVETVPPGQKSCPSCHGTLSQTKGIEVGHTFYLGTKYSYIFSASFRSAHNKPIILDMGCFGLGVSRILAASIEVLSTEDGIRWPSLIAPYQVCIVPPKRGSKEEAATGLAEALYDKLTSSVPGLRGEVLLDDRTQLTIGKRLKDASKLGYPFVLVAGQRALEEPAHFEVCCQNSGQTLFLSEDGVIDFLRGQQAR
ncbi:probable proline--tRNA ligase, mitochondrial [Erpetoichthys calabaricus]|uniref:probable proline--tRNA ligase, mitochondrial n=1 Tax=Erpetoichthys calabaricus TaxID=27687 RepID=UPI00223442C3|nr:probable proline--tRNA ligase, mitochondrial [Erpetoichthys calabaricus]